jgi:hypothetical protein
MTRPVLGARWPPWQAERAFVDICQRWAMPSITVTREPAVDSSGEKSILICQLQCTLIKKPQLLSFNYFQQMKSSISASKLRDVPITTLHTCTCLYRVFSALVMREVSSLRMLIERSSQCSATLEVPSEQARRRSNA